jgi:tRNA pseudouridine55 synthase
VTSDRLDRDLSRVVLVDKPAGWTSFEVVRRLRMLVGRQTKVGHAGTLDPFATGLLLVLLGQATRISSMLMSLEKTYVVTAQFGAVSSTQDPSGVLVQTGNVTSSEQLETALSTLRGRVRQRVPMTSAVKVGGQPLYRRAHRGEKIETPEREVTVYEFSLLAFDAAAQRAVLRARTSKGTYVRTLVHDLGALTGAGGYAAELRRTRVGPFSVEAAAAPESFTGERLAAVSGAVKTVREALGSLPCHLVEGADAERAAHGRDLSGAPEGRFRVEADAGLLGIYEGHAGLARPLLVFSAPQE